MHTLARFPAREARLKCQVGNRAFTLIELLTVIAIIAILAGITLGVIKGVNERSAIGRAKAELSVLSQALEAYKLQYGDYPRVGMNAALADTTAALNSSHTQTLLFNALAGKLGPKLSSAKEITDSAINGKSFVELARFSLETTNLPSSAGTASVLNCFIDPWGRRYMYYYAPGPTWRHQGYILFSAGPDATGETAPTVAMIDTTTASNLDNIYANKN